MDKLFVPILISRTGQPELPSNENILFKVDNVTIYDGDKKSQYLSGTICLTQMRIIWINNKDIALALNHQLVLGIESLNTGFMQINSSPKILITLVQRTFRLSFHAGKRDEFLKEYQNVLIQFRQQKDQQNKLNTNMVSPPSYQQHQQQQQQQQNPFLNQQIYQQPQPQPQPQSQQYNNYNPYQQNQYQSPIGPPIIQNQPQLPSYMLNSINNNAYNPYQQPQSQPQQPPQSNYQSYLQQQQQQIPQYQQFNSPPNYTLHMQQHQSSSPPLHVNINNQFIQQQHQQQQPPPPPPSYQETIQQQKTSIYGMPPTTSPNQSLQNFINQPNNNNNRNNEGFTSNAGIGGILKQINKKTEENDKLLTEAFSDLNALMEKAKDMVTLLEKLKITLDKKTNSSTSTGDTTEEEEFRSFLMQMGIESPVTKKSAKSKYHVELSKQLSEWIINKNVLKQQNSNNNNGMITLSDLYCIFNRARGIELISPDDLYRACLLFESLDLPLRLRKFDSGVIVVQSKDENDQQVAKEILNIIKESGPISAFDLSKIQSISLNLAKEQLFTSEKIGVLCRDETLQGILFHENIFII